MGNAVLNRPAGRPCCECADYDGIGFSTNGKPYVACARNHYHWGDPAVGCKFWNEHAIAWPQRSTGWRIIVCGGLDFIDRDRAYAALDKLLARGPIAVIVQGGGAGADLIAQQWAKVRSLPYEQHDAQWNQLGPDAGAIRHQAMADAGADGLVALPGGPETVDMVQRAEAAAIPVWRPYG